MNIVRRNFIGLFILVVIFVFSSCQQEINNNQTNESNVDQSEGISSERPMEYISNHFLDMAMSELGISNETLREIGHSENILEYKYKQIGSYLNNSTTRGSSNITEEAEEVFKEVYEEMASAIESIQVTIQTEDGNSLDLTNANSGYLNGIDFHKSEFISLVDNENAKGDNRGVWKVSDWLWPSGNVKYRFNDGISDENKEKIKSAMKTWEDSTKELDFKEIENTWYNAFGWITGTNWHVSISDKTFDDKAGQSTVGYGPWKYIDFNPNPYQNNSYSESTILHEIGHTLGLRHEHQRYDRDQYIEINWSNIVKDQFLNPRRSNNFGLIPKDNVIRFYLVIDINLWFYHYHWGGWIELARWENSKVTSTYDYNSIMHYPSFFGGSANDSSIWSIRRKAGPDRYTLGGSTLTPLDIQAIKSMY